MKGSIGIRHENKYILERRALLKPDADRLNSIFSIHQIV
jgi:hypothetical protein